jgi:hypothetical protein
VAIQIWINWWMESTDKFLEAWEPRWKASHPFLNLASACSGPSKEIPQDVASRKLPYCKRELYSIEKLTCDLTGSVIELSNGRQQGSVKEVVPDVPWR